MRSQTFQIKLSVRVQQAVSNAGYVLFKLVKTYQIQFKLPIKESEYET